MKINKNVISFLNMKGGVCKTTLCKEMALFISERREKKILVIDIDPQANCTQSFFERYDIIKMEETSIMKDKAVVPSIQNVFTKPKDGLRDNVEGIICKLTENLHLIPGDLDTVFMERETASGTAEQKLFNFIYKLRLKDEYDYIFIDCPPTYSFYTVSALLVSDYYFVPLVPDIYSLLGLDLLQRVVYDLEESHSANFQNHTLENLGVIFTKVPKNPGPKIENNIKAIKESFKDTYFFENNFSKVEKLSTSKLSTFIIDREDVALLENLSRISDEFIEKVGE